MGSSDPSEEMIGRELIGIHSDSDYADARLRFGGVLKDTRDEIRRRIDSWHNSMPAKGDAPYDRERMLLESEERDLAAGKASLGAVLEDIDLASDFRSDPYLGILWGRANAHRDDRGALLNIRRETLSRWRSMYDAGSAAEYRGATDDDAASAAESVRASVRKSTEAIALGGRAGRADFGEAYMTDARGSGRSPLRPSDLSRAAAMAGGISSDPEILALCRSLGKRITPEEGRGIQSVPSAAGSDDLLSHEEITGTGIGRSISDMVPSELLYLGDAVLERIFDLDYAERMMLVFAREGSVQEGLSESSRSMKEPGPAIICVDTSGSMRGKKEDAAKAAALAICSEMLSENRACYLIDFSVGTDTEDLSETGISGLAHLLSKSFGGGTDPSEAFRRASEAMGSGTYGRADVLMISDFDMRPDDLCREGPAGPVIAGGARLHALIVGRGRTVSDHVLELVRGSGIFASALYIPSSGEGASALWRPADHHGALGRPDDALRDRTEGQPAEACLAEGRQDHEVEIGRHRDDDIAGMPLYDLELGIHSQCFGLLLDIAQRRPGFVVNTLAVGRRAVAGDGGGGPGIGHGNRSDLGSEDLRHLKPLVDGRLIRFAAVDCNENLAVHDRNMSERRIKRNRAQVRVQEMKDQKSKVPFGRKSLSPRRYGAALIDAVGGD